MGMPIVLDIRDDDGRRGRRREDVRMAPVGRCDVQHLQARQRDQPPEPRRASPRGSARRSAGRAVAVRGPSRRDRRLLRRPASFGGADRPVRSRQRLGCRPRSCAPREWPACATTRSVRAATCACAGAPCRSSTGASGSSIRSTGSGREGDRDAPSSPSPPLAHTPVGIMSGTRVRARALAGFSRSRWSGRSWKSQMRSRRQSSRWVPTSGHAGRRRYETTRR